MEVQDTRNTYPNSSIPSLVFNSLLVMLIQNLDQRLNRKVDGDLRESL